MRAGRVAKSAAVHLMARPSEELTCRPERVSPGMMRVSPSMIAGPLLGNVYSGAVIEGVCEAQPAIRLASVTPETQPNVRFAAI
ncbi:hypothetical protein D3C86_939500 [compost metagenome]